MPMNEKLTVALSKGQIGALRRAIASSHYADADEIMSEALDDWLAKRDAMASDIELLRRLCSGSTLRGEVCPVDFSGLHQATRHQHMRSA